MKKRHFPNVSKGKKVKKKRRIAKVPSSNYVPPPPARQECYSFCRFCTFPPSRTLPKLCLLRCAGEWDGMGPKGGLGHVRKLITFSHHCSFPIVVAST